MNLIMSTERKICKDCLGNGYLKTSMGKIVQCLTCASEGETDENGNALHMPIVLDELQQVEH